MLYADDLVLVAESLGQLREKILRRKECIEPKGLKNNISKTKVIVSEKSCGDVGRTRLWSRDVCGEKFNKYNWGCIFVQDMSENR